MNVECVYVFLSLCRYFWLLYISTRKSCCVRKPFIPAALQFNWFYCLFVVLCMHAKHFHDGFVCCDASDFVSLFLFEQQQKVTHRTNSPNELFSVNLLLQLVHLISLTIFFVLINYLLIQINPHFILYTRALITYQSSFFPSFCKHFEI